MATVTKNEISNGAELTIQTSFPQLTAQSLFSFINSDYASYFTQEFKYSVNGGTSYTSYETLNESNIRDINATNRSDLVVIYKYVRTSSPTSSSEIAIRGIQSDLIYPFYDNTFFKDFIDLNDYRVLQWALSVLEKLYDRGILPWYLDRNVGNSLFEDEDFISYWYSICHFYGILVVYARQYQDIRGNDTLLKEFLTNIGIYWNRNNTITELQYLFDNYISEFEKRGTNQINTISETTGVPNGEMLRLIDYISTDEYIFCLTEQNNIGWNIGTSSPCYRGTEEIVNCIKKYEYGEDVTDLSLYPLENDIYITLEDGYIKIDSVPSGSHSGLSSTGDSNSKIYVNPEVNYEISFKIKKDDNLSNVNFGVTAYDQSDGQVDLLNNSDGSISNNFFTNLKVCNILSTEYWVRGVIYNKDESNNSEDTLNISQGNNLRFNSSVVSIIPSIRIEGNAVSNTTYIRDIKVRPSNLPFSQGMFGIKNLIINWLTNNSGLKNNDITRLIKKFLIPYNSTYYPVYLESTTPELNYLLLNTGSFVLLNSGGRIIINN